MRTVDTHAHLDELDDLDSALNQAASSGVAAIVAVGQDRESNRKVLEIARKHPGFVFPAVGLHPWNIKTGQIKAELEFIDARAGETVGIGEIGLDYHKRVLSEVPKDIQKQVLSQLMDIAVRHDKPALLHSRYAWRDCFAIVKQSACLKAVFHWYTGPSSVLRDIVAEGYYLSATPALEYHQEHRRAIKETALDRLLLETDSPVVYARGREEEFKASPADVRRSLAASAGLHGVSLETLSARTTANAVSLFGLRLPSTEGEE